MQKIKSKDELVRLINSLDRVLSKAKTAHFHFNELMQFYHNGYKEVMRQEEGYWDSVALAFLDSCTMQLALFYDKQVTGTKGEQSNGSMEYFLSQIRTNQLVQSWIPDYHRNTFRDLRKDFHDFTNFPARSELNRLRNKNLAHRDLSVILGNEKPIAMEIKKFGDLITFGTELFCKYERIFEYSVTSKLRTTSSFDDRLFESIFPGLRAILVKLKMAGRKRKVKSSKAGVT